MEILWLTKLEVNPMNGSAFTGIVFKDGLSGGSLT